MPFERLPSIHEWYPDGRSSPPERVPPRQFEPSEADWVLVPESNQRFDRTTNGQYGGTSPSPSVSPCMFPASSSGEGLEGPISGLSLNANQELYNQTPVGIPGAPSTQEYPQPGTQENQVSSNYRKKSRTRGNRMRVVKKERERDSRKLQAEAVCALQEACIAISPDIVDEWSTLNDNNSRRSGLRYNKIHIIWSAVEMLKLRNDLPRSCMMVKAKL